MTNNKKYIVTSRYNGEEFYLVPKEEFNVLHHGIRINEIDLDFIPTDKDKEFILKCETKNYDYLTRRINKQN